MFQKRVEELHRITHTDGAFFCLHFQHHLKNDYSLEKKLTQGIEISAQLSLADMDSTLNGSLMNREVTCQDYFKGIYTFKGNNYSNGRQV